MTSQTDSGERSAKRMRLCSREHADRVAGRLFEQTRTSMSVVRTGEALQPFRVVPTAEASDAAVELQIRV